MLAFGCTQVTVTVEIPQLPALTDAVRALGDILMAGLQEIVDAVTEQGAAIVAELEQLAAQEVIDPAEVQALADTIRANTEQIKGMVPDTPDPLPPPAPAP